MYITMTNNVNDEILKDSIRNSGIIKRIIYSLKNKSKTIFSLKIMDKNLLVLPNLNKSVLDQLEKTINIRCIKLVCLSQTLLDNKEFVRFLEGQSIKILDGKWLFKYLVLETIQYIVQNKKEKLEEQKISIITNDLNEEIAYNITQLADNLNIINVVTKEQEKFKTLKEKLFEEKEVILNITNSYKKGLIKSDIIINFDLDEEALNRYILPEKGCIINIKNKVNIISKKFEGVNICSYKIVFPDKYIKNLIFFKDFNEEILYESLIYKTTSAKNIVNEINNDGVCIAYLSGINGKIKKIEYAKMTKVQDL